VTTTASSAEFRDRAWWAHESRRRGSDWAGVINLHIQILDHLRAQHAQSFGQERRND
jgi:hypothetical protein